jgi:cytochrome c-type biogenesis protein CcmH/NrfF
MDIASVFEWFAQESMKDAEQAKDPRQREMFLRLASMWAAAARQCRNEAPATQATSASS